MAKIIETTESKMAKQNILAVKSLVQQFNFGKEIEAEILRKIKKEQRES